MPKRKSPTIVQDASPVLEGESIPSPVSDSSEPKLERVPIDTVYADPANVRRHPERNRGTIRGSLARFGPGRSIVLDRNNVIRAGNGTVEEAKQAGFDEVLIVEPKANQLVAVKRPDWSPSEATAYAIADNRAGEQAEWAYEDLGDVIRSLQAEDFDISSLGFAGHELEPILAADWSPPALEELPSAESNDKPEEPEPHTVVFSMAGWETIQQAVLAKRDEQHNPELTEAQCLELICAGYLLPA